jgi:hypothetical protein
LGKKSKHDLTNPAYLKVPRKEYFKYVKEYGKEGWAEGARDVLDLATGAFKD